MFVLIVLGYKYIYCCEEITICKVHMCNLANVRCHIKIVKEIPKVRFGIFFGGGYLSQSRLNYLFFCLSLILTMLLDNQMELEKVNCKTTRGQERAERLRDTQPRYE
jgi:hypothetical protein